MKGHPFIIRAYGIYIDAERGLLVSDEFIKGKYITKFPGGGLEFGEGLVDCLKREMKEETGQDFKILDHFYTTDFFVASAFDPSFQVISIYYRMEPIHPLALHLTDQPFKFSELTEGAQSFRFIPLNELQKTTMTLVIDRRVVELLGANQ
jgi:8-oxo-dGTP diphosphatase